MTRLLGALFLLLGACAAAAVPPRVLERAIGERIGRVEELAELKRLADLRGVKIYLFGGSASALAHYVRWDLERQRGNRAISKERFDDTFLSIYRPGQDADVLVDGTAEDIAFIGAAIRARYPYVTGEKDTWELRSLRETIGTKEAILDNRNFSDQHTDHHSTGVVALNSGRGEPVVRDALDWDAKLPPFLADVAAARARFRFSKRHRWTQRARQDLNPPILSVIRYFIKVSQFGLTVRAEDRAALRRIVAAWDPEGEESAYVSGWFARNTLKIVHYSIDLAKVWDEMDSVGLRRKLIGRGGDFGLWFGREPLRDRSDRKHLKPHGAPGATARDWNVSRVAHATRDHQGYDNLRRSPYGVATVFISRKGHANENASAGSGFYTKPGDLPGKTTGWTMYYEVDPRARENVDFFVDGTGAWVWLTRDKLHAEPTQRAFEIQEAFEIAADVDHPDRGLREQMLQRLDYACQREEDARTYVADQIDELFGKPHPHGTLPFFLSLKGLVGTERWLGWMRVLAAHSSYQSRINYMATLQRLGEKNVAPPAEVVTLAFGKGTLTDLRAMLRVLPLDRYPEAVRWVANFLNHDADREFLLDPRMQRHPEYRELLRSSTVGPQNSRMFFDALTSPLVDARDDWFALVDDMLEREDFSAFKVGRDVVKDAIERDRPEWPELVAMMLRKKSSFVSEGVFYHLFFLDRVKEHADWPRWVRAAMEHAGNAALNFLKEHRKHPDFAEWREIFFAHASSRVALSALEAFPPEGAHAETWHRWFGAAMDRAERHEAMLVQKLVTWTLPEVDEATWLPAARRFDARIVDSRWKLSFECGRALAGRRASR